MDISLAVLLSDLQDSLKNEHKNIIVKRLWIMILPEKNNGSISFPISPTPTSAS